MIVNYGPATSISENDITIQLEELKNEDLKNTQKITKLEADINGISTEVSNMTETADKIEQQMSTVEQTVDKFKVEVSDTVNGIQQQVTTVNASVDGLEITVKKLEQETGADIGNVLRFDADNGLVVDSNGDTVQINKGNLNLTGSIQFADLYSSTQTTITNASTNASNALFQASQALAATGDGQSAWNLVKAWRDGTGKTYIDGNMIASKSILTEAMHLVGCLTLYEDETSNSDVCGYMGYAQSKNDQTYGMHLESANNKGELHVTNNGCYMRWNGTANQIGAGGDPATGYGSVTVAANGTGFFFGSDSFYPGAGKTVYCGTSNNKWAAVYATNGTIQTSDENEKNNIEELPNKYLTMFDNINAKRYKMNDGTSGRYHVGFIAQDVEKAMIDAGIDSQEFGGFVTSKYEDEEGNEQTKYMLRYDEFIGVLFAKVKQLEARIEELEAK